MQAPLPRRSKGPSAIAAASAAVSGPGSRAEGDSEPGPELEVAAPISAVAAAFAAERTAEQAEGTSDTPAEGAAPRPPAKRRLPRVALLAGAAVVVAALIGGAVVLAVGGDPESTESAPGAAMDTTRAGESYEGKAPEGTASASPSTSPSADRTDARSPSPSGSPGGSPTPSVAKDGATGAAAKTQASATPRAADAGDAPATGSGGDSDDSPTSCVSTAGSGPITDYSACAASGTVTFKVTFNNSEDFYHAFIDTDGDTGTGYQLPYPSPSALGADYMIENGVLYRSRSTSWKWSEVATRPTSTVRGSTYTWKVPLSGIGSPSGTQRVEFNAGTDYTSVITFRP